ncbi:hypothetical protein L1F30_12415 [Simiduia sp. 21SJ11W-1]|uniref:DUF6942 family protein n=1 Tax=Simiduia sp. 21SJ11W-1 TaxID=2909669 RepID=UPI0020A065D7|nr:hypothetical protein [Simiduia sp. 21SJ11W-1]UTA46965.1 hypothetical protein L1F30_12415 [Simiduia sp. 21SJ11W-1]
MAKGLGTPDACMWVSIANCPPQARYQTMAQITPLAPGELQDITANSSNHWRKLFNVYAKLLYALNTAEPGWIGGDYPSWQTFRDGELLQAGGRQALLFGAPPVADTAVTLIAGKTWAQALGLGGKLQWLDAHFAVYPGKPWLVCPYFDYRQLTNARIDQLVTIVSGWARGPIGCRAKANLRANSNKDVMKN